MIVGATCGDSIAALDQRRSQRLGIVRDLPCIDLEFGLERFTKSDSLGRDHMHQGATLKAREDRRVDLLGDRLVIGENQAAARAAQGFVGCRRHHMGMRERRGMHAASDKAAKCAISTKK